MKSLRLILLMSFSVLIHSGCNKCKESAIVYPLSDYAKSFMSYETFQWITLIDSAGVTGQYQVMDARETEFHYFDENEPCPEERASAIQVEIEGDSVPSHFPLSFNLSIEANREDDLSRFQFNFPERSFTLQISPNSVLNGSNATFVSSIQIQGMSYDSVWKFSETSQLVSNYDTMWFKPGVGLLRLANPNGHWLELVQ